MVIALNPHVARPVTLDEDASIPEDKRTVFMVRPPTHGYMLSMPDVKPTAVQIVEAHLDSWQRLNDYQGEPVAYPEKGAAELLSMRTLGELARKILELGGLTQEDKGK